MKLPTLFIVFWLLSLGIVSAQNKLFLYGFEEIPQSLLENPGGQVSYKKHISSRPL